jgi:hypothetical protein
MPSLTLNELKKGSALHSRIIEEVRRRVRMSVRAYQTRREEWRRAEDEIIAYIPESDADAVRRSNRDNNGVPSYSTIKIPYTFGVTMSYWTYMCSVFLSRTPIYQFEGAHGETQQQVLMVEALHDYQNRVGRQLPVLFCWLYDVSRYGCGIVSCYWQRDIRHVTEIQYVQDPLTGMTTKEQVTLELPGYTGNEICNMRPRDFLPDPRVPMSQFQRGEFCGTRAKLSWLQIKQREKLGYYTNIDSIDSNIMARHTDDYGDESHVPSPEDEYLSTGYRMANEYGTKPDIVPIYEMFIELIPSDWGLGESDYPEKWVFTVTGDWRTVLGAQPHGAYHAKYPYAVLELEPDAYALSNRGMPEIIKGVQQSMDWLLNSHMFNVRAGLNNLFIVDPMRVVMKDLTSGGPGGLVRLRPGGANGASDPVKQIPIGDVTRNHVNDFMTFLGIGERTSGISDQMMGASTRTGRKTATEVRTASVAGASREKVHAEYMSATGWTDLGAQLIGNSQQYYDDELVLKITGNLAQMAGVNTIRVTPEDISGGFMFTPVDGTLPIDRFAQANLWKEFILGIERMPTIGAQYDIGRLFAWVAQLSGLRNIDQFRIEVASPQQLATQMAQGNVIPLTGRNADPNLLKQPSGGVGPIPVGGGGLQ